MDSKSSSKEEINQLQIELKETKNKLKLITQKFANTRKERDNLKKENKELQNEVIALQSNIREMVPGFSNTSSSFPMFNELLNQTSDFLKCDCQDVFFDILCPELNMDGIVFFFQHTIPTMATKIHTYFDPLVSNLQKITCLDKLDGPIMNVLKKVYQNNWKNIAHEATTGGRLIEEILEEVQSTLRLGEGEADINQSIKDFIGRLVEIGFCCYISDPTFAFGKDLIGERLLFNSLQHECIDGFLKNKDECIIILPPIYKGTVGGEILVKAQVLPLNYEFP